MEEEIELRELIEILINRKNIIAIITLGAILISFIFSFIVLKPTYEAKMVLMASNLGESESPRLDTEKVEDILSMMSKLSRYELRDL